MKKTVYLIEFNNGDVSIQRSITTLKNAIYKWCIYNDEYYLTDHQLNSIIHNRLHKKPLYIKYLGRCELDNLFEVNREQIKYTKKNNQPLCEEYVRQQINKQLNDKFKNELSEVNLINYKPKFTDIINLSNL